MVQTEIEGADVVQVFGDAHLRRPVLRLVLQGEGGPVSLVRVPPQPDESCPRPTLPHLSGLATRWQYRHGASLDSTEIEEGLWIVETQLCRAH